MRPSQRVPCGWLLLCALLRHRRTVDCETDRHASSFPVSIAHAWRNAALIMIRQVWNRRKPCSAFGHWQQTFLSVRENVNFLRVIGILNLVMDILSWTKPENRRLCLSLLRVQLQMISTEICMLLTFMPTPDELFINKCVPQICREATSGTLLLLSPR